METHHSIKRKCAELSQCTIAKAQNKTLGLESPNPVMTGGEAWKSHRTYSGVNPSKLIRLMLRTMNEEGQSIRFSEVENGFMTSPRQGRSFSGRDRMTPGLVAAPQLSIHSEIRIFF